MCMCLCVREWNGQEGLRTEERNDKAGRERERKKGKRERTILDGIGGYRAMKK